MHLVILLGDAEVSQGAEFLPTSPDLGETLLTPRGRSSMSFQGTLGKIPWPLLCLLCWD